MAKVYGNASDYQINRLLLSMVVLFSIIWVALFFISALFHLPSGKPALVGLGIFIVAFVVLRFLAEGAGDIGMNFVNGLAGEKRIYNILKDLPDGFTVFWGLKTSEHFDTDFVVLGPTGVFVVEVKSQVGKIDFNGQQLTQYGRTFGKDFLKQAKGEAKALNEYINRKTGTYVYVEPILVFSSRDATMRFGKRLIDGVMVIKKDWLIDSLCKRPLTPTNNHDAIERALIEITPNA